MPPQPSIIVNTFADYLDLVQAMLDGTWYFRGHSNDTFDLICSAGRRDLVPITGGYSLSREKRLFEDFSWELPGLAQQTENRLEAMALSRHHALPNRLLDWSENPLTSAFFASEDNFLDNGCVHAIRVSGKMVRTDIADPFDPSLPRSHPVLVKVRPRAVRLQAQQGIFSLHPNPTVKWALPDRAAGVLQHRMITIPSDLKADFIVRLSKLGFHRGRLMPDIDGLCARLKTEYRWVR